MTMNKRDSEESNLQRLFNTTPISMFVLNEDTLIEKINDAALDLFQLNREDALGKRIGNGLNCQGSTEDNRGCRFGIQCKTCKLRLATRFALETGQATTRLEYSKVLIHNEKEKKYWFRASLTPLLISGKNNVVVALDNITDSKLVEDSAKISSSFGKSPRYYFVHQYGREYSRSQCGSCSSLWLYERGTSSLKDL